MPGVYRRPIESDEFKRKAEEEKARRSNSNATPSQRFGLGAPPPEFERKIMESDVDTTYQLPLQNNKGEFFYMVDFDEPNDPRHPIR